VLNTAELSLTRLLWAGVEQSGRLFLQLRFYAPALCFAANGSEGSFCPPLSVSPSHALFCTSDEAACVAAERLLNLRRQATLPAAVESLYLAHSGTVHVPPGTAPAFATLYGLDGALLLDSLPALYTSPAGDAAVLLPGAAPGLPLWLRRLRDVSLPAASEGLREQRLFPSAPPTEGCSAPTCLERAFLLVNPWQANFQHWLLEQLPRLALLGQLASSPPLLLQPDTEPYQLEILAAAGVPATQLRLWDGPVHVRELYLPGWPCINFKKCSLKQVTPLFAAVRANLSVRSLQHDGCAEHQRRLYISRNDTAHTAGARRRLDNDDELRTLLLQRERFTEVATLGLGAAQRVSLFRCVREVVALYGAGLMNMLFLPSGARLLALSGQRFRSHGGRAGRRGYFAQWAASWNVTFNEAMVEAPRPNDFCAEDNCPWRANLTAIEDALLLWRRRGVDWD